jgi:hypothetical protein
VLGSSNRRRSTTERKFKMRIDKDLNFVDLNLWEAADFQELLDNAMIYGKVDIENEYFKCWLEKYEGPASPIILVYSCVFLLRVAYSLVNYHKLMRYYK